MSQSAIECAVRQALRSQRTAPIRCLDTTRRHISTTTPALANPLPITATGPPPQPPTPSPSDYGARVDERRRKAALIQQSKDIRASQTPGNKSSPLRKRFWKDVHVKPTPDNTGYQIFLDSRPVRTPTKQILTVPKTKPALAHAVAIEWDLLTSAQQALKQHNIPMTSIVSRAQDMVEAEAQGDTRIRKDILRTMIRYLDTDTLLCWAPDAEASAAASFGSTIRPDLPPTDTRTLRDLQRETAEQIIGYLNSTIWPGVSIKPVLEEGSILPTKQSDVTRNIIEGWISGLPCYELVGLERAVLASKSLLVGTRLLIDWSGEFRDLQGRGRGRRFGIEEAALASTIEVRWQTGMWGEVEDSHDVDKEDVRRQFGSAVLVVCGGS